MSTAIVNGAHTEFIDVGAGSPLLLLHGFPFSGSMWHPQQAALASRFRLVIPDLPGFGHSEPITNPHLARWADQVAVLLEQLRIPRLVVGGLSMGGYVALALARRHPGMVRALILANTRAAGDDEAGRARREATALSVLEHGLEPLATELVPKLLGSQARPELASEVRSMILACSPRGAADACRAMARRDDSTGLLRKLQVPVLVITGDHDALIPPDESARMVESASHGRLAVIAGAGHLSNLERPDEFSALVREFIESLGRSSPTHATSG